jgi:hypothetical protein
MIESIAAPDDFECAFATGVRKRLGLQGKAFVFRSLEESIEVDEPLIDVCQRINCCQDDACLVRSECELGQGAGTDVGNPRHARREVRNQHIELMWIGLRHAPDLCSIEQLRMVAMAGEFQGPEADLVTETPWESFCQAHRVGTLPINGPFPQE